MSTVIVASPNFYADDPRPEPEPDTRCDGCGHDPCSCDQEYEAYRDRWLDDHYDYLGVTA